MSMTAFTRNNASHYQASRLLSGLSAGTYGLSDYQANGLRLGLG